ncbi:MAG: response regulator [Calditerrivibrio sp.]|nr:response regulator [Calditerrivibrio sp.]
MKNRIMLVDDSITIHRVIDLSLETDKFDVEKAFAYEDAIQKMKSFNPEVVLLDNKLEGIDVKEFIKEIKDVYKAKVILLVGAFDNFDERKVLEYGSDDFLIKPFNSQSLEDKLSMILPKELDTDIVVPLPEEKDAAVEELMSQINEDIDFNEINDEIPPRQFFEETELSIDLEEKPEDISKIEEIQIEEKKEDEAVALEGIDTIFSDLEEIDTDKLQVDDNKEELITLNELEKEFDEIKTDKLDIFEDLISQDKPDYELKEEPVELPSLDETDELKTEALKEDIKPSTIESIEKETSIPNVSSFADQQVLTKNETVVPTIDETVIKKIISEVIDETFLKSVLKEALSKQLEKAIWEIVPELAEKLILAEIEKIKSMDK